MAYSKKWGTLTKPCYVCKNAFVLKSGSHKFCSVACKRVFARTEGCEATDKQYELISGDWGKFIGRLLAAKAERKKLTKEECLQVLEKQKYLCALTGVPLTCVLKRGQVSKTNLSIDRIDPKGPYVKENIQLVCAAVNKFRVDMPLQEFIDWCKKVNDYAVQKQK